MNVTKVADDYSVTPQIRVEDLQKFKERGFRSIMCNRPDGEDAGQPDFAVIAAAAQELGLATAHVPLVSGVVPSADDISAFTAAMADLPGPVIAYCRSGTRSRNIWLMSR